jgi:lysophospholipase L1-like esterase
MAAGPADPKPRRGKRESLTRARLAVLGAAMLLVWPGAEWRVRAELVLANYSSAQPIKVMAIGDSITDDCEINGAWRAALQGLLQTNGYPFTFVGRQSSSPAPPAFTKTRHEGYCGAVIAAPGVLTSPVHGYAGAKVYLENIVPDALAEAANRPDLVLLLIGANDIGRGRNPYTVATNDMPNLLAIIFSNAPAANVVLAKITTLQNADLPGLDYGLYATNVAVYNAALQAMVNQHRAQGQNVFLADMFSVVNYNTMFLSEHLHPNAAGLQAVAKEFLSRIQALTIATNGVCSTLVHGGDVWKYSDAGVDLGTNWSQPDFDDSAWSSGVARLGYGDTAVATTVSFGPDSTNKYPTTYFRRALVASDEVTFTNLNFRLSRADGAVVWLNGLEVFRTNLPSGPISYTNLALATMGGDSAHIFYPTNIAPANLNAGTNILALELHPRTVLAFALGFDLEVIGSGYLPPPLSISANEGGARLSWAAASGAGYSLYSTDDLGAAGEWSPATVSLQTNDDQIIATLAPGATTLFFRLRRSY